jgi:hypothetical protein
MGYIRSCWSLTCRKRQANHQVLFTIAQGKKGVKQMTINVLKYRISFFQIEVFNNLISPDAPFGFLATPDSYESAFTNAQTSKGLWVLPAHSGNFWRHYLHSRRIEEANSREAPRRLLPVFTPSFMKPIFSSAIPGRATLSGYCWPHCLGVVLNLFIESNQSLQSMVQQAFSLRYDPNYLLNKTNLAAITLGSLLDQAMEKLRNTALGPNCKPGTPGELFSVITFIDGDGVDCSIKIVCNSLLHKALFGLCKWNRGWDKTNLVNFDHVVTPFKDDTIQGHALFHSTRGRVVWFPSYFNQSNLRIVGCYHSNLTTLSLQVESLGAIVKLAADKFATQTVPQSFLDYSHNAAVNLSLFYGGSRDTYRSASARDQITENSLISSINTVRHHLQISGPDLV